MSALVNAFIAGRHLRFLRCVLWCALFSGLLLIGYGFIIWQVGGQIRRDNDAELERLAEIRQNVFSALHRLQKEATAPTCSPLFLTQMQTVAFLPDGLNEFLYAPHGIVRCSTSQSKFETPVTLGAPDIKASRPGDPDFWIGRDLASIGRPGFTGTFAMLGPFVVAIPPYSRFRNDAAWLEKEIVARSPEGRVWNVAGNQNVYRRLSRSANFNIADRVTTLGRVKCDAQRVYCVASQADLLQWGRSWATILSSIAVLAALFAWVCAVDIIAWLKRYWSFEARFCRYLSPQSIVVSYQPVLDVRSGKISGCEVLARWRDVDGTIVPPDRFIGIVERTARTLAFTRMVANKAYEELRGHVPADVPLQINFNAFARDFASEALLDVFSKFRAGDTRFTVAVELVESNEIDFEAAQVAIEELGQAGIKTYIDDFGTGYSSIERLVTLAVHGVKLDRSFAMAPADSILGRMLVQILEMIRTSGRVIVVEGVETEARLNLLRSTGAVDYVQGYVLSRPVGIDEFVAFLTTYGRPRDDKQLAA